MHVSNNQVIHISMGTSVRCLTTDPNVDGSNEASSKMCSKTWGFKSSLWSCVRKLNYASLYIEPSIEVNVLTMKNLFIRHTLNTITIKISKNMTVSNNQVIHIISMGTLVRCLTTDPKVDGSNGKSCKMFSRTLAFRSCLWSCVRMWN